MRAAARKLCLDIETIRKRVKFAEERGLTAESPIRDPLEKERDENRKLRAEIAAIHRANETAEEVRRRIYELKDTDPEPPKWASKDHAIKIEGPGVPMMNWSDWHWGEVVNPKEVNGINTYNSDIAEERVQRLVARFLGLVRHHMPTGVPGAVIVLGGDMITGEIHQELADTNDEYILQSIRRLKGVLAEALSRVADVVGKLYVVCIVGNHGRMTLKPRLKGRVFTNYEWNIYTDLEDRLKHDKRIKFYIPDGTDALFSVYGHRFLATHGDTLGVKGGDGMIGAIGPIMRGAMKVGKAEAQIGRDFDTLVIGHWHQYLSMRGIIVNNCLKGYDEFAKLVLRAPATPASQALWFVHKKWGINTQMEIYVQDPFNLDAIRKAPWVQWRDQ
jgi:hypothetical protein